MAALHAKPDIQMTVNSNCWKGITKQTS